MACLVEAICIDLTALHAHRRCCAGDSIAHASQPKLLSQCRCILVLLIASIAHASDADTVLLPPCEERRATPPWRGNGSQAWAGYALGCISACVYLYGNACQIARNESRCTTQGLSKLAVVAIWTYLEHVLRYCCSAALAELAAAGRHRALDCGHSRAGAHIIAARRSRNTSLNI